MSEQTRESTPDSGKPKKHNYRWTGGSFYLRQCVDCRLFWELLTPPVTQNNRIDDNQFFFVINGQGVVNLDPQFCSGVINEPYRNSTESVQDTYKTHTPPTHDLVDTRAEYVSGESNADSPVTHVTLKSEANLLKALLGFLVNTQCEDIQYEIEQAIRQLESHLGGVEYSRGQDND